MQVQSNQMFRFHKPQQKSSTEEEEIIDLSLRLWTNYLYSGHFFFDTETRSHPQLREPSSWGPRRSALSPLEASAWARRRAFVQPTPTLAAFLSWLLIWAAWGLWFVCRVVKEPSLWRPWRWGTGQGERFGVLAGGRRKYLSENLLVKHLMQSYQRDSLGGHVQHFDLVVVGVGHIKNSATVTGTDSSRFVEAGLVKTGAKSIPSLTSSS